MNDTPQPAAPRMVEASASSPPDATSASDLRAGDLRGLDLRWRDLTKIEGLAGADLTGAKLPEGIA